MTITDLPALNATLNLITVCLLVAGYRAIRDGRENTHRRFMLAAVAMSSLFFFSYGRYHWIVGSIKYPHFDWTRSIYFAILIPHIILASIVFPCIFTLLWFAVSSDFKRHKALARRAFPAWIFVSVTGIIVYLMLFHL